MKKLKRYKITADSICPNWDAVEDPKGMWIFDPGHEIDLDHPNCGGRKMEKKDKEEVKTDDPSQCKME